MAETLLDKVWDAHTVRTLPSGQTQLFFGLHLIHEVTSPQAFQMLREMGLRVRFPERTFATIDHIVPTASQIRPFRDVLATQCLAMDKPKLRKIQVEGRLARGVYAKDVILAIIHRLGVKGGVGYAYEYAGSAVDAMSMEERLTICNMSIEGGARVGYVNPDATTFAYLRGRPFAPQGETFDRAVTWWTGMATDPGAAFDDVFHLDAASIEPMVTWGINPRQSVGVGEPIPHPAGAPGADRGAWAGARAFMSFEPGRPIVGTPIDVAFIGSCTNARLSDPRAAAQVARGRKAAKGLRALVVPG